ncbi:uncharacterized protein LOC135501036 [Lineus longissimus]|uniref:uncharacterized protein LOC135501036 n=1 Tax=Lineus longissimus TaxID=88925 RepID=UPI00315D5849
MYSTLDQCGKPQSCYCAENQPGGVSRCFNMDFSVKPQVSSGNGLNADTASGRHDAEYFIGIEAENWAGLTSNFEMMITIDASPPHVGIVHDGLASDIKKEVDFQQSYSLAAHWDGFLDRESGVRSYSYVFGTSCLDAQNFPYTTAQSLTHDRREATWRAPGPGRYYVTVVAYNAAFSPSEPVCSDGVLVDTTRPVVSELGMKSIAMKAGLMKKSETKVYYLQENGLKMKIDNPSTMCRTKALYFPGGTDKFSFDREHDGSIKTIDGSGSFCQDKLPLSATFPMGLTQDKMIEAWWSGSDPESGIRHYEVALASRPGDEDIMAFEKVARGTTGYYKKYHPGLEEGKVFYFIVRGTNQAMLQATQAFGPFIVDVVVPTYSGAIMPYMDAGVLMVAYDKSKFDDGEDADTLTLEFAVGTRKGATDVISWHPLVDGAPCKMKAPSHCTTIQTTSGDDFVQGKTYYVSLQATNAVGRSVVVTADPLVHFMDKPSEGVVMDTEVVQGMASVMLPDIFTTNWARFKEDVDYQTIDNQIDAKWYGFERPSLTTSYMVGLGDVPGTDNVVKFTSVRQQTKYRFRWIPLKSFVVSIQVREMMTNVLGHLNAIRNGRSTALIIDLE